jgi:hypothetical protein
MPHRANKLQLLKLRYIIGVYDPLHNDYWHCQYEYGQYLSAKHRIYGWDRAAEFPTEKDGRDFYFQRKHVSKYKFELIPVQFWVIKPDPVYAPEHPK